MNIAKEFDDIKRKVMRQVIVWEICGRRIAARYNLSLK